MLLYHLGVRKNSGKTNFRNNNLCNDQTMKKIKKNVFIFYNYSKLNGAVAAGCKGPSAAARESSSELR